MPRRPRLPALMRPPQPTAHRGHDPIPLAGAIQTGSVPGQADGIVDLLRRLPRAEGPAQVVPLGLGAGLARLLEARLRGPGIRPREVIARDRTVRDALAGTDRPVPR